MKFCFFGYDHTLDIAQRLVSDGHELMKIFSFPCDNHRVFNKYAQAFAQSRNIAFTQNKITPDDISDLVANGCNLFFSAGYPHKIPPIPEDKAYGINLHPALLPRARGVMPIPHIIMTEPEAGGFTIHKLTPKFDQGDILYQQKIEIDDKTDIDTLAAKTAIHTAPAASKVIASIEEYWKNAKPQDHSKASHYSEPDEFFRTLHWQEDPETLARKGRAFGRFGIRAIIRNNTGQSQKLAVFQFSTWAESHKHEPGTLIRSAPNEVVIAVQGGYACLIDFQIIG